MAAVISERIRAVYSGLSKGQKKIANAVLNDYDKVAYLTAAKLGDLVGVSESTVVRFADELGFEGYSQFQLAVQELVRIKLTPNQRIELTKQRIEGSRVRIAKTINILEQVHQELEWVFEANKNWNSDIMFQVEEAIMKLGMSLATLTNWWDDPEEEDE